MRILSRVALFVFLFILAGTAGIFSAGFIFATEKIDINTASYEKLQEIIWVGPVISQRIIEARPFYSLDDLTRVKGIGEKRLEDIKKQGLAWVSPITPDQKIEPEPSSEEKSSPEPEKEVKAIYPSGIVINEILPNTPVGIRDEEGEYIEIFNQNDFEVDLTGWQIEDTAGRTTTYTFPQGTKILAQGFFVLYRPTSKITLNNDGDGLNLFQPDGKIINTVNYEKAPRGQSYNRTDSKWVWSTILTPGRPNEIPVLKTEEAEFVEGVGKIDINTAPLEDLVKIVHIREIRAQELISLRPFYSLDDLTRIKGIGAKALEDIKKQGLAWVDPTLKPPKIEKETEPIEKGLAAVGEPFKPFEKQIPKSLSVFLIALALAIFSGIIILILKRKLKSLPI